jgi:hypothetical protein
MRIAVQDLRFSFRQLVKIPGFALTAIVSLALGIGATTAVFSVVYAIVVDPYPYANSDRMVHMRLLNPDGSNRGFGLTGGQWQRIRQSPVVEDAFLTDGTWALTITGNDVPEDDPAAGNVAGKCDPSAASRCARSRHCSSVRIIHRRPAERQTE